MATADPTVAEYLGEVAGVVPVVVGPAPAVVAEEAEGLAGVEFFIPSASGPTFGLQAVPAMPGLRVIQSTTAGVEHLLDHVPRGVQLCSARGVFDDAVAEWVVAMVLAWARRIPEAVDAQRARRWRAVPARSLRGATVLVVGHGAIGRSVESRLRPFGTTVRAVARTARDGVAGREALPDLVPEADVVVLTLPLTAETHGLVDEAFLALMRDASLLVNPARGGLVAQDALVRELRRGRISAALDVTDPEPLPRDSELWALPNVTITPHSAGSTTCAAERTLAFLAEQ
ncbi:MAG TPA: NAD(P)-dependent oxidoreductase, partial [Iamia sp.]|nr:NAD(P)-dependent oxidoreductase [Iamia sp.]